MADTATQPKPTPNRRRRGRNQSQNSAQKAYASENDAAIFEASNYDASPQTPSKQNYASPEPKSNRVTSGKQRMRSKTSKQKNAGTTTSPEPDHPKQTATPQRPVSMKAPGAAFAGATFHASPAPSALPIPSFLSKPASGSPAVAQEEQRVVQQQPSPPATDTELPTPHRPSPAEKANESPLDFMFRAQRQERERKLHGQSPNLFHNTTPPSFSSPLAPKTSSAPPARSGLNRRSSHGIDFEELNGSTGQPMGPAFSTPYQDRIKAAKSNQARPINFAQNGQHNSMPNETIEDPTEALKRFLFNGNANPSNPSPLRATPNMPSQPHIGPSPSHSRVYQSPPEQYQHHNLQAMENDLRRILKLDNGAEPSTERRLFTQ